MIESVSPADFAAAIGALAEAYHETFSGPPWDDTGQQTTAFAQGVPHWVGRDGFRAYWERNDSGVLGFAFRVRTPEPVPDVGFYALLRERFGGRVEHLSGAVEVVELAVRPRARGRGLGRELLTAVTADERAWLVTRAAATGTLAFYRRLGWRQTAEADGLVLLEHS